MNITTTFLGVLGFAIIGPLVLAAVVAGVMVWLSRQSPAGAPAAQEATSAKARSPRPPAAKPAPPAEPQGAPTGAPEVETFVTEAAMLEKEETHHRLVPLWLAVVYAVVIVWALIYILTEVVPFFRPLMP